MSGVDSEPGVYADVPSLVKLRYQATGFSFLPKQPVHSLLAGRHASRLRGRGLEFEEIRRYVPGDDPRTIDWKVTARTRKPHTRVYTEERDRPALLVVDQRLSMFFGSVRATKAVVAAEAAALAGWRVLESGDRVGALIVRDDDIEEIRPVRSQSGLMHLLKRIVDANQRLRLDGSITPNPGMLNRALEKCRRVAAHDALVVIVSDLAGADSESRRHVTMLSEHNDVLVGFIYDPLEAELPAASGLVASSGPRQLELDTRPELLRARFREDFRARLATVEQTLKKRSVPILPIATTAGVAEQVRATLGRRTMR